MPDPKKIATAKDKAAEAKAHNKGFRLVDEPELPPRREMRPAAELPDPDRPRDPKAAAADATRVAVPGRPDPARLFQNRRVDQIERDRADSALTSLRENGTPSYKVRGPALRHESEDADERMKARTDSIVSASTNAKRVTKDLFDVDDDIDKMKKSAATDLHRAKLKGD